jgi:tetratricopeptide (TPR) repeat protein
LDPDQSDNYVGRAAIRLQQNLPDHVLTDCTHAIKLSPRNMHAYTLRSYALARLGRHAEEIVDLEGALRCADEQSRAMVQAELAWSLATCPDASCRDGRRALELAKMAEKKEAASPESRAETCEALAAAFAETGDFASAVRWQETAIRLMKHTSQQIPDQQSRLSLYRAGKPYRSEPTTRFKQGQSSNQ